MARNISSARAKRAKLASTPNGVDVANSAEFTDDGLMNYVIGLAAVKRKARERMLNGLRRAEEIACRQANFAILRFLSDGEWNFDSVLECCVINSVEPHLLHQTTLLQKVRKGEDVCHFDEDGDWKGSRILLNKVVRRLLATRQVERKCGNCGRRRWTQIRLRPTAERSAQSSTNTGEQQRRHDHTRAKLPGAGE